MPIALVACSDNIDMPDATDAPQPESKYLTFDEALKVSSDALSQFISSEKDMSRSYVDIYKKGTVSLLSGEMQSRSQGRDSAFYVVNFDGGGAVILAADRRIADKVYAITPDGHFDATPNPAQEVYMNWAYEDAHYAATDSTRGVLRKPVDNDFSKYLFKVINGVPCTGKPKGKPISYSAGVIGKTTWHQMSPYGKYASNGLTGCVPLAMGQIMAFHKKPTEINGYSLNWDEILSTPLAYSSFTTGVEDIAVMMRELGIMLGTKYLTNPLKSETYSENVPGVFRKLGYTCDGLETFQTHICVKYIYGGDVPQPNSPSLNKPQSNGPVYMRGTAKVGKDTFGHGWVVEAFKESSTQYDFYRQDNDEFYCTEYHEDTEIYINWGFGGSNNGYYKSPGTYNDGSYTYTTDFKAVYVK